MTSNLKTEKLSLYCPELSDLAAVLEKSMKAHFQNVTASVVDCPNLTNAPFNLISEGLCGNVRIADVGGVPYLMPKVMKEHTYEIKELCKLVELQDAYVFGAGAGPFHKLGMNAEMICDVKFNGSEKLNTKLGTSINGKVKVQKAPCAEFGLLGNLGFCDGKPGKVIELVVSKRISEENIMSSVRKTLKEEYKDKIVGMCGTFNVEKGKVKIHCMPDFCKEPIESNEDVNNWLDFYEIPAPFTAVGWLISDDPDMDIRVEHFHGLAEDTAGHYHYDVTPDEVVYRCYFSIPKYLYRIDRPEITHTFGRD
ncbi:unnamed protein product [Dimorphilus gyrociliatus]|uniref:DUF1907 domain-containing protein n=1 Tax=Dimorphilus gyrociliatus TaxID=2664684 RepID=A0A7I8V494_9ANNE|nr:unnamed protein product [Dimorphilus gyrociliatus]